MQVTINSIFADQIACHSKVSVFTANERFPVKQCNTGRPDSAGFVRSRINNMFPSSLTWNKCQIY